MEVVYEDNHVIIVNKASGEIVQGDKTGDVPLSEIVKMYIKEKYQKPGAVFLGVVHHTSSHPLWGIPSPPADTVSGGGAQYAASPPAANICRYGLSSDIPARHVSPRSPHGHDSNSCSGARYELSIPPACPQASVAGGIQ